MSVELLARELDASLEQRERDAEERKRAQADQVDIALEVVGRNGEGAPEIEATVENSHERQQPIYDVKLYWFRGPEGYGTPNPQLQNRVARRLRIDTTGMITGQTGRTRRHMAIAVTFGFGSLIDIGALLYALIH